MYKILQVHVILAVIPVQSVQQKIKLKRDVGLKPPPLNWFPLSFQCSRLTVTKKRPLPVKHWPERWLTVKCVTACAALGLSHDLVGKQKVVFFFPGGCVTADQQDESEWRLAFDLQQAKLSRRTPAKQHAENWAGDLWAPLARRPAGQRGEADGPSGDLLAQDGGLLSSHVCASLCVRVVSTDWATWRLETTCLEAAPRLFHVRSAAPLDAGVCWDRWCSSSITLPCVKRQMSCTRKTLCGLVMNIILAICSSHIDRFLCSQKMATLATFFASPLHVWRSACCHVQTRLVCLWLGPSGCKLL